MGDLKKERGKYRNIALKTLEQSEMARNDDWTYIFGALYYGAGIRIPKFIRKKIRESGLNINTLLRERQKIQNGEGLYPPSPEVQLRRKNKQKQYAEVYKKGE